MNYLQRAVSGQGVGDVVVDYSSLLALGDDAAALVAEINLVLCANQLSARDRSDDRDARSPRLPGGSDVNRLNAHLRERSRSPSPRPSSWS